MDSLFLAVQLVFIYSMQEICLEQFSECNLYFIRAICNNCFKASFQFTLLHKEKNFSYKQPVCKQLVLGGKF